MGIVIGLIIGTLAGAAGVFAYLRQTSAHRVDSLESKARVALAEAERDAETSRREALVEAKDEMLRLRQELEDEIKARRTELDRREERMAQREQLLQTKDGDLDRR